MFGKPEWFREKTLGWGLTPITWQGWVYTLIWVTIISGPCCLLAMSQLVPEALVWAGVAVAALIWDVRKIIYAMHADEEDDLFVIEDDNEHKHLDTRNYEMRLRD